MKPRGRDHRSFTTNYLNSQEALLATQRTSLNGHLGNSYLRIGPRVDKTSIGRTTICLRAANSNYEARSALVSGGEKRRP